MALGLVNPLLDLNATQLDQISTLRNLKGYHVYYQGRNLETTYTLHLGEQILLGTPTVAVAAYVFDKTSTSHPSRYCQPGSWLHGNSLVLCSKDVAACREPPWFRVYRTLDYRAWSLRFKLSLRAIGSSETIAFEYSRNASTTGLLLDSIGARKKIATTDYQPESGMHILRTSMHRSRMQFYVDDKQLFKAPTNKISNLRSLVIEGDAGMYVFEAHNVDMRGNSTAVFKRNGFEVPVTPALYPSSYVEFSGNPLENKRSWITLRYHRTQRDPTENLFIRKQAGPFADKVHVVLKFYEEHVSIWSSEGFESVVASKLRTPRCLGIYDFVLDELLMSVPSS